MYKILLVEDEMVILTGLKKLIMDLTEGFVIDGEARSGREALAYMRNHLPDLIMTDINMKEMNGLELIEQVRGQYANIPIVIISGYSEFEYVKSALRNRVADYLLKPVDRLELTKVMRKLKQELDEARGVLASADEDQHERPLIRKIKKLIQDHLDKEITLQFIAEHVHLNHQYVSSLFKFETGQNFMEYVTEQRIDRAKKLLLETNLKIYEIAHLSGYANAKHFMMIFKQAAGVTASEYRDGRQNGRKVLDIENQISSAEDFRE